MAAPIRYPEGSEQQLIRRTCAGDAEAFYALVRPYEWTVYVAARALTPDDAAAEKLAQTAILNAYLGIARFRGDAAFGAWLVELTFREARSRQPAAALVPVQAGEEYQPRDLAPWQEVPCEALQAAGGREALAAATAALPARCREVFVLRDVLKLSTPQAARILAISEDAVKTHLARARLQMRDEIARLGAAWRGRKEGTSQ